MFGEELRANESNRIIEKEDLRFWLRAAIRGELVGFNNGVEVEIDDIIAEHISAMIDRRIEVALSVKEASE